jgi:hypothetical protein
MNAEGNISRQALDFSTRSREVVMDASRVDPKARLLMVQGEVSVPVQRRPWPEIGGLSARAPNAL